MDNLREWGEKYNIVDESDVKKEDYWLDLDIQVRFGSTHSYVLSK